MSNLSQFTGGLLKFNKNQKVTVSSTAVQSAAFDSDTVAIIVTGLSSSAGVAYIEIGSNPTATTDSFAFLTFSDSTSNQNCVPIGPIGVEAGHKISCLKSNSTTFHIMELKY